MINIFRKARRDREGFTLAETLVVIVILVALAAIAVPLFVGQLEKSTDAATMSTVSAIGGSALSNVLGHDQNPTMSGVNGGGVTEIELVSQTGVVTMNPDGAEVFAVGGPDASWCVSKEAPMSGRIFVLTSFTASVTSRTTPYPAQSNCSSATDQPASATDPGGPSGDPGVPGPIQNFHIDCEVPNWGPYAAIVNNFYGGNMTAAATGGAEYPQTLDTADVFYSWDLPAYAATSSVTSWDVWPEWGMPVDPANPDPWPAPAADGNPVSRTVGPVFSVGDGAYNSQTGIVIVPRFEDGSVGEPFTKHFRVDADYSLANPLGCQVVMLD